MKEVNVMCRLELSTLLLRVTKGQEEMRRGSRVRVLGSCPNYRRILLATTAGMVSYFAVSLCVCLTIGYVGTRSTWTKYRSKEAFFFLSVTS